jgi:hypothetical protein
MPRRTTSSLDDGRKKGWRWRAAEEEEEEERGEAERPREWCEVGVTVNHDGRIVAAEMGVDSQQRPGCGR